MNERLLEILGYEESELLGNQILKFTHPDFVNEWEKLRKELWCQSNSRSSFSIDTCLIRKNGTVVWCHVTSILFEDNGNRLGYTVVEDVSDRKEAEYIKEELAKREHLLALKDQEHKNQRNLLETVILTQEAERERIAEQLHNGLGQMLYAVKLNLEQFTLSTTAKALDDHMVREAKEMLSRCIMECRRTAHHLLPKVLNDFGLKAAPDDLCRQFHPSINFKFQFERLASIKEKYAEVIIFRIVQELLLNIAKHAKASEGACKVQIGKKQVTITVEDNGKGLMTNPLPKNGLGLSLIRSRIDQMHGSFDISSGPQQGTIITFSIPLSNFK